MRFTIKNIFLLKLIGCCCILFSLSAANGQSIQIKTNAPKILKPGDKWEMKVMLNAPQSTKDIIGTMMLELKDAKSKTSIDGWAMNVFPFQYFTIEPQQTFTGLFPFQIPYSFSGSVHFKILVKQSNKIDSTEGIIQVKSITPRKKS
jgi:hypothetical protein